ncbi:nitroreductase family protein [Candidatus Poriferisodalis sp.]|uniref:nitroreductase family protein n=1 Tax=Candidatus Poriferisodalis sp. TaxID=3101277 RepID=UPI003B01D54B
MAERYASLMEVIRLRRSVRSFEPPTAPLPFEVLRGICEAGRWAPSGANTQPWHFVIAAERTDVVAVSEVFVRQADRLVEHCRGFPHVHKKHWLHNSLAIVLLFCDPRWVDSYPVSDHDGWRDEYAANNDKILLASVGAAAQNMHLAAAAYGLTTAWLSGGGEDTTARELRSLLCVPEPLAPIATVPIGWPHRRAQSRYRHPLDALIHWGRWDATRTPLDDAVQLYISESRRDAMYRESETATEDEMQTESETASESEAQSEIATAPDAASR